MLNSRDFKLLPGLTQLLLIVAVCLGCAASTRAEKTTEQAAIAERIAALRSVTYYTYDVDWEDFDLVKLEQGLDDLQSLGVNSIWFVLPWKSFQPVALPEATWNEAAIETLEKAVGIVEQRGMTAILPLCYLGKGWEPGGVQAQIWTLDESMYQAFTRYSLAMIDRLAAHKNTLFLLYTEGCEPYVEAVREFPIAVDSFRTWAKTRNADLSYWNARWETNYSNWDDVQPIEYLGKDKEGARFDDHWRWCAALLRERHGPLARQIREKIKGRALLGYHDYSLIAYDWAKGESPIPDDVPYDFLSTAGYYGLANTSYEEFESNIKGLVARCHERYPQLPLAMLEAGASAYEVGWQGQAQAMKFILEQSKQHQFGVNFWMYQDFTCPDLSQAAFGLLTPQGKRKPSYGVVKDAWASFAPAQAKAKE